MLRSTAWKTKRRQWPSRTTGTWLCKNLKNSVYELAKSTRHRSLAANIRWFMTSFRSFMTLIRIFSTCRPLLGPLGQWILSRAPQGTGSRRPTQRWILAYHKTVSWSLLQGIMINIQLKTLRINVTNSTMEIGWWDRVSRVAPISSKDNQLQSWWMRQLKNRDWSQLVKQSHNSSNFEMELFNHHCLWITSIRWTIVLLMQGLISTTSMHLLHKILATAKLIYFLIRTRFWINNLTTFLAWINRKT